MDFEIDVIFEVCGGIFFSIEVNRFETIRDVKDKIQTIHQIPISQQYFIFKGQLLQDHLYVYTTPILHRSRIHLFILTADAQNLAPPPPPPPPIHGHFFLAQPLQPSTVPKIEYDPLLMPDISSLSQRRMMTTLTASVKMPKSRDRIRIESDRKDTVGKLKEKIAAHEDMQGVPVNRIALQLHSMRQELNDHVALQEYAVVENPEIDVFLKPPLPAGGRGRTQSGKLKVKVLPMLTNERIEIEVFPLDTVSVLRPKLEELQRMLGFRLPEGNAYFFIHKQQDMHEDQSFHWHGVSDGDTIETFDGFVITNS
ncbi:uncharacterized protein LOC114191419 [Vigna unguiculata]|uniref:Ubiquitin-like domain-containing protein n=1 Tax=Vigna unguiculata TaxID=3917 RepID=A0A4D6N654_VIGUN|nr:uncharacterized protein LOC114191419 [Vigna unguiculata]QCE08382.1 hypothetical protein DEO72_LG9g3411 [Vigna unguiculata]